MTKKKKAKQEAPAPAPKPAKKPKYEKSYSPWPAVLGMVLTVVLGGASMVGVHTYQTYRDEMFANQRAAYEQAQQEKELALRDSKWDLIRPQNPLSQTVAASPEPEAPAASPEPSQAPETPPAVPEEPSPAPAPAPATEPSQKPQETQAKAPSTPSTPASNQTPAQAKPQETQPEAKPSNSDSGQQSPGVTIAPSSNQQTNSGSKSSGSPHGGGESSTTNEITGALDRTAYWVDGGKSYHFSSGCRSLANSKNIREGTLQDALNAGKTDPCNNCAGGS